MSLVCSIHASTGGLPKLHEPRVPKRPALSFVIRCANSGTIDDGVIFREFLHCFFHTLDRDFFSLDTSVLSFPLTSYSAFF